MKAAVVANWSLVAIIAQPGMFLVAACGKAVGQSCALRARGQPEAAQEPEEDEPKLRVAFKRLGARLFEGTFASRRLCCRCP